MMPRLLPPIALRVLLRPSSSSSIAQERSLDLFSTEQERQRTYNQDRISKLHVHYRGLPTEASLLMNRGLSTPFDCAAHLQEALARRSVVALLDGRPWAMRQPLEPREEGGSECELRLCHMKEENPSLANAVFWRSCSVLLGSILHGAFKTEFDLQLCSFPPPDLRSGSFVYDVRLTRDGRAVDWQPSAAELRLLSCMGQRLALEALPFEPLEMDVPLVQQIFAGAPLKSQQIVAMAAAWKGSGKPRLTVYRVGRFLELTRGPLMSHTGQVGRFAVTAAHRIETPDYGPLLRFQSLALPPDFLTHYTTFDVLRCRAAKLNPAPLPTLRTPSPEPLPVTDV